MTINNRRFGLTACAVSILLLIFALFSGQEAASATGGIAVERPWVRVAAAPGRPSAGYMALTGGARDDALVGASSTAAERIEMHRMAEAGGVMRMEAVKSVAVPANGRVSLEPGGTHLMIYGLKPAAAARTVPLTLRFASGQTATVNAELRAMGADGHQHR